MAAENLVITSFSFFQKIHFQYSTLKLSVKMLFFEAVIMKFK
jgi:hypothetical protein